jgi:hypothetical protein
MSQIRITTLSGSGIPDPVVINDLGAREFTGVTNFVLYDSDVAVSDNAALEALRESEDLQEAIDNGYIRMSDESDNTITDLYSHARNLSIVLGGIYSGSGIIPVGTVATGDLTIDGVMDILHTATAPDDHALELDVFAEGNGDVKAVDIVYDTGVIQGGDDEAVILSNIIEDDATGGTIVGYEVIATEGSATIYALGAGAGVNPVEQQSGTFTNVDFGIKTESGVGATDETAAFNNQGTGFDISIFDNNGDDIIIGKNTKFTEIEFLLNNFSNPQSIDPTFAYWNGSAWTSFIPIDGTNGMQNSGIVIWTLDDISDWATNTQGIDATPRYRIRITRTRGGGTSEAIEAKIQVAETVEYKWDKDGNLDINAVNGVALTSSGSASNFLREDGTYGPATGGGGPDVTRIILHLSLWSHDNGGGSPEKGPYKPDGTSYIVGSDASTNKQYVTIEIPEGKKATHVMVYSNQNRTYTIYTGVITDGTRSASLLSGNTNTELDIPDQSRTTTNYLQIEVTSNSTTQVWGGYVTITDI